MSADVLADLEVESLGCVLANPSLAAVLFDQVRPEQFTSWRMVLAQGIAAMVGKGMDVSPTTVAEYLRVNGLSPRCGALQVFEAYQASSDVLSPASRFSLLAQRYLQRDLDSFGMRLQHLAATSDPTIALEYAKAEADRLSKLDQGNTAASASTMAEFLSVDFPADEWCIPGVLPSATSLMVTATEGMGKSVFLRQLALSAALGIHPFDPSDRSLDYAPQRALIVDAEYTGRQVQRQLSSVSAAAARHVDVSGATASRVFVHSTQHGMDLTDHADQAYLRGLIRSHRPTILVIGPLYRCTSRGYMDEDATRLWQQPLEAIMADGVAVVIEHHIGNEGADGRRSLRPIGSSAMRRWAAQGVGFRQMSCKNHDSAECKSCGRFATVEKWRGGRDETYWPTKIKSPTSGGYWWERDVIAEGMAA